LHSWVHKILKNSQLCLWNMDSYWIKSLNFWRGTLGFKGVFVGSFFPGKIISNWKLAISKWMETNLEATFNDSFPLINRKYSTLPSAENQKYNFIRSMNGIFSSSNNFFLKKASSKSQASVKSNSKFIKFLKKS